MFTVMLNIKIRQDANKMDYISDFASLSLLTTNCIDSE